MGCCKTKRSSTKFTNLLMSILNFKCMMKQGDIKYLSKERPGPTEKL